ncbi:MAG TPA: hypothetical protein VFG55_05820 [Rhodanobacteraceae bacterium]|nr:hypothetical protein [Rhodanobacteraceae bacterium]
MPAALPAQASTSFEVKKRYRFNPGGEAGFSTDWERLDPDGFDGLLTSIDIGKVYGKPRRTGP